jgi:WD40 repeat protein
MQYGDYDGHQTQQ